jgi:HD-like signal output (HDOD) protein
MTSEAHRTARRLGSVATIGAVVALAWPRPDPSVRVVAPQQNPAEQRQEMIRLLGSIDRRLGELKDAVAKLADARQSADKR